MHYPSSENKGADQLRGYREADLRLCFRICRLFVFSRGGSYILSVASARETVMFTIATRRYFYCVSICFMFWSRFVLFEPRVRFHIFS